MKTNWSTLPSCFYLRKYFFKNWLMQARQRCTWLSVHITMCKNPSSRLWSSPAGRKFDKWWSRVACISLSLPPLYSSSPLKFSLLQMNKGYFFFKIKKENNWLISCGSVEGAEAYLEERRYHCRVWIFPHKTCQCCHQHVVPGDGATETPLFPSTP